MFAIESVDDVVVDLRAQGGELIGEVVQYEEKCNCAICEGLRELSWR
jgi:hypothetical protein